MASLIIECKENTRWLYRCIEELEKIEGVYIQTEMNYGESPLSIIIDRPEQEVIDKIKALSWVATVKEYRPLMFTIVRD
jgi:hypothetical protein